jgi:small subunit ribosomal protein S17
VGSDVTLPAELPTAYCPLRIAMSKAEKLGTVVSDKMTKTVVVAVERVIRHELYGKAERRTTKFVAHDEQGAKEGDEVVIVESRPLSRRKRWVVTRVVRKAARV